MISWHSGLLVVCLAVGGLDLRRLMFLVGDAATPWRTRKLYLWFMADTVIASIICPMAADIYFSLTWNDATDTLLLSALLCVMLLINGVLLVLSYSEMAYFGFYFQSDFDSTKQPPNHGFQYHHLEEWGQQHTQQPDCEQSKHDHYHQQQHLLQQYPHQQFQFDQSRYQFQMEAGWPKRFLFSVSSNVLLSWVILTLTSQKFNESFYEAETCWNAIYKRSAMYVFLTNFGFQLGALIVFILASCIMRQKRSFLKEEAMDTCPDIIMLPVSSLASKTQDINRNNTSIELSRVVKVTLVCSACVVASNGLRIAAMMNSCHSLVVLGESMYWTIFCIVAKLPCLHFLHLVMAAWFGHV